MSWQSEFSRKAFTVFQPSWEVIERYAKVLVNFGLWGGQGVRKGDVVLCVVPEVARPMYAALRDEVLRAGAYPIMDYRPVGLSRSMFDMASVEQLGFVPEPIIHAQAEIVTGRIAIIPLELPTELEGVDPRKVAASGSTTSYLWRLFDPLEAAGKFSWTLGAWGVEEFAHEVGMTLEEYWQVIIDACYLDDPDPVARWRETFAEIRRVRAVLTDMQIDKLYVESDDVDLWVPVGQMRQWQGATGRNIPSFEVFVSPDNRGVNGWIRFNQPLYNDGVKIEEIELEFKNGKVVHASAASNGLALLEIIKQKGGDRVGEFSLTDGRLSRITRPMASTLFDENMGGPQGNTHIALGSSYANTYAGNPSTMSNTDWEALGFNQADVHVDIISTARREVTAYLSDGSQELIYANGRFLV